MTHTKIPPDSETLVLRHHWSEQSGLNIEVVINEICCSVVWDGRDYDLWASRLREM